MGQIIVILLIIIILLLIAPFLLGLIGLLAASALAYIIKLWWLYLIAFTLPSFLPWIFEYLGKRSTLKKESFTKRKFILIGITMIIIIGITTGILINKKIILIYPLEYKYNNFFYNPEGDKLKQRLETKLYNDRGNIINDTIPFGKFYFGMKKENVLPYLRTKKMSNDLFLDKYTICKIQIIDTLCNVPISFYFDTQNRLREVNILIDKEYKTREVLKEFFGDKYIEETSDYNLNDGKITWCKGNQKITLYSSNKYYSISFKDYNYNNILNSSPLYNPLQETRKRTIRSGTKKLKTILGFEIGMTKEEIEQSKKRLITQLINKKAYMFKDESIDLTKLKKFLFFFNDNQYNCIGVDSLQFSFNENRLYCLEIFFHESNNYDLLRKKHFNVFDDFSSKKYYDSSKNEYCWINENFKINYSWNKITYEDTYISNYLDIDKSNDNRTMLKHIEPRKTN